jgi:hypothetical protein
MGGEDWNDRVRGCLFLKRRKLKAEKLKAERLKS